MTTLRTLLFLALVLLFGAGATSVARADDWDGNVYFDFTPYVWVPTINGDFRYNFGEITGSPIPIAADLTKTFDTTVGPNSYLANLNFALMGSLRVRKGNFSIFSDFINANASGQGANVRNITGPAGNLNVTFSTATQTQIVSTIWTIDATYSVFHGNNSSADLLVGDRLYYLSTNANFQLTGMGGLGATFGASAAAKETHSNFVFGSMGQIGITPKFSFPYYIDFGTGSLYTWEGVIGAKYGNLSLDWRHLQYDNSNASALLQRISLDGPLLGYTLRF